MGRSDTDVKNRKRGRKPNTMLRRYYCYSQWRAVEETNNQSTSKWTTSSPLDILPLRPPVRVNFWTNVVRSALVFNRKIYQGESQSVANQSYSSCQLTPMYRCFRLLMDRLCTSYIQCRHSRWHQLYESQYQTYCEGLDWSYSHPFDNPRRNQLTFSLKCAIEWSWIHPQIKILGWLDHPLL